MKPPPPAPPRIRGGEFGILLGVAFLAIVPFATAQDARPLDATAFPYELAITQGDQTVRVEFQITVNGKLWRQHFGEVQRRAMQAAFAQLDADRDGTLSPAEAKRLPPPRSWATLSRGDDVHVAFNFRILDANDDGTVSAAEFEQYALTFGDVPVRMLTVPAGRSTDDLFRVLDADRDRVLTAAEWSAVEKLQLKDRDGDRVLTIEELRGPTLMVMPPEFVASAPVARVAPTSVEFEWKPAADAPADAEIFVDYAEGGAESKPPQVTVKITAAAAKLGLMLEKPGRGDPVLLMAGRRLVLRIPPPAVRSGAAMRQQILQEFAAVLDQSERQVTAATAMPPLLKSVFGIADRNDDGRLEPAELEGYVNGVLSHQTAADAARLRFVKFNERPGLMPLVDLNCDGRLSRRELQRLPATLACLAGDSGKLAHGDLPPTVVLVLERGPFGGSSEQNVLENAGPPWFLRADRNHDGDLDREEFLGSPEDFDRLDKNKDGWIDLDEAILGDTASAATGTDEKN